MADGGHYQKYSSLISGIILSTIATVFYFVGQISNPDFLIPAYLILGGVTGWIIYKRGFLSMKIPHNLSREEKDIQMLYYETKSWIEGFSSAYQIIIFKFMLLSKLIFTLSVEPFI